MKRIEDVTAEDVANTITRLIESRATEQASAQPYLSLELLDYLGTVVQSPMAQQFITDLVAGKSPVEAARLSDNAAPALIFHLGFLAGREMAESDQFASLMGVFGDDDATDAWAKAEASLALETAIAAEPESPEQYRMIGSDDAQIYESRARCLAAAQEFANSHDQTVLIEERKVPEEDPDAGWTFIDSVRPQGAS